MQIPGELIIVAFIILALLAIMVLGVENTIPMLVRTQFDDICNNYLAIIEKESGLSTSARASLTAELEAIGITNINITAPVSAGWGDKVELIIEGDYVYRTTRYHDLSKTAETKRLRYRNSTVVLCLE